MDVRRLVLLAGVAALVAGIIGLLVPVSVSAAEGQSVSCGNGIAADLSTARAEDDKRGANIPIIGEVLSGGSEHVAKCESALSSRRAWAIPVAVIGALAVVGALVLGGRTGRRKAAP